MLSQKRHKDKQIFRNAIIFFWTKVYQKTYRAVRLQDGQTYLLSMDSGCCDALCRVICTMIRICAYIYENIH